MFTPESPFLSLYCFTCRVHFLSALPRAGRSRGGRSNTRPGHAPGPVTRQGLSHTRAGGAGHTRGSHPPPATKLQPSAPTAVSGWHRGQTPPSARSVFESCRSARARAPGRRPPIDVAWISRPPLAQPRPARLRWLDRLRWQWPRDRGRHERQVAPLFEVAFGLEVPHARLFQAPELAVHALPHRRTPHAACRRATAARNKREASVGAAQA
eukprot:3401663-Prymnesium_polylepis.2